MLHGPPRSFDAQMVSPALQMRRSARATFATDAGGSDERLVDRVRVLWPDHLGLARGQVRARGSGRPRRAPLHGHVGARLRPRDDPRDARQPLGRRGCPTCDATYDARRRSAPGGSRARRSSSRTWRRDGELVGGRPAHRAAQGGGRLARGWATSRWSASSSRPTSSSPTAPAAGARSTRPGAFVYGTGPAVDPHGVIDDDLARQRRGRPSPRVGQLRVRHAAVRVHPALPRRAARRRRRLPLQAAGARGGRARRAPAHVHGQAARATAGARACTSTSRLTDASGANAINDAAAPDGLSALATPLDRRA